MKSKIFGPRGDFTTSPEISQLFGELVGTWFVNEWNHLAKPLEVSLIELGPGRGTLLSDVLRVFSRFPSAFNSIRLHLVEISPQLRAIQEENLKKSLSALQLSLPPVTWYEHLTEVPRHAPSFILANEFFDALPVHQFQKVGADWQEVLVDVAAGNEDHEDCELRFVRSSRPTVSQVAYLPLLGDLQASNFAEVSPQTLVCIQDICRRIAEDKGAALVIDYGHEGEKGNTLRAFCKHELCDPLLHPGEMDLTCDVNFALLKTLATRSNASVDVHGPVSQAFFLINMGLLTRLKQLATSCKTKDALDDLMSGCEMLITKEQMGERFKFLAIVSRSPDSRVPPGFAVLPGTPYDSLSRE